MGDEMRGEVDINIAHRHHLTGTLKVAMAMREAAGALIVEWRERGLDLGFGAGIAQGYATLGPDRLLRTRRVHRYRHRVQCCGPSLR
jgi:hypothetical protein